MHCEYFAFVRPSYLECLKNECFSVEVCRELKFTYLNDLNKEENVAAANKKMRRNNAYEKL